MGGWVSPNFHLVQIRKTVRKNGPPLIMMLYVKMSYEGVCTLSPKRNAPWKVVAENIGKPALQVFNHMISSVNCTNYFSMHAWSKIQPIFSATKVVFLLGKSVDSGSQGNSMNSLCIPFETECNRSL